MADSPPSHTPIKPNTNTNNNNKKTKHYYTQILFKTLLSALGLSLIALCSSKVPIFMTQTVLPKFWDLAHLLFIGLAVSYGLFSQRKRSSNTSELNENNDTHLSSHTVDDPQSFVSRIFHVPSGFEDGFGGSLSGFDQKSEHLNWVSHEYYKGENFTSVGYGNSDGSVVDKRESKGEVFSREFSSFSASFESSEKANMVESWKSLYRYHRGESVDYVVDGDRETSLGLPVRRLRALEENENASRFSNRAGLDSTRSRSFDEDGIGSQFNDRAELDPGSSMTNSYGDISSSMNVKGRSFGDVGPMNLEDKFNETTDFNLQFPRLSGSENVKVRENTHFMPLSVDQSQFDSSNNPSLRSVTSLSSRNSSMLSSPTAVSPSLSTSSEPDNPNLEESSVGGDRKKGLRASYPPASRPLQTINSEAPLNAFHLRRYSSGSLFQKKNSLKSSKHEKTKALGGGSRKGEDSSGSAKEAERLHCKPEREAMPVVKSSSMEKYVGTKRANKYIEDAIKAREASKHHFDMEHGKAQEQKPQSTRTAKTKSEDFDHISVGNGKKQLESLSQASKPILVENRKRKEEDRGNKVNVAPKEDPESDGEYYFVRSNGDAVSYMTNDSRYDPSEVDKKASEFIAKFREQIRLQKVASAERTKRKHHHKQQ